jgi:hypothetical protein
VELVEVAHLGHGQGRENQPGSIKALYSALKGWSSTAPAAALRWWERAHFVNEHPGWTYRDYDEAEAGDILLDKDYRAMLRNLQNGR